MADLPADRYIKEALRRAGFEYSNEHVLKYPLEYPTVIELARMIEKYEPTPEPVDPDLLIAREACATAGNWSDGGQLFREGAHDEGTHVQAALRAIKLAREKGVL